MKYKPGLPSDSRDEHLVERQIESTQVYKGKLLNVRSDRVLLPDGTEATREYIMHSGAAMIIPVLPNGDLVMERQFRYPVGRVLIEFPAGKLDPGEEMLVTAQRELLEETGYRAAKWEFLAKVIPIVSYTNEQIEIFLATELTLEKSKLDVGEFLEVFTISFDEAFAKMKAGEIVDGKTVIGLYMLRERGFGQS